MNERRYKRIKEEGIREGRINNRLNENIEQTSKCSTYLPIEGI